MHLDERSTLGVVATAVAVALLVAGCTDSSTSSSPTGGSMTPSQSAWASLEPTELPLQEGIPLAIRGMQMILVIPGTETINVIVDGNGIDQELELTMGQPQTVEDWTFELLDTAPGTTAVRVTDPDGNVLGL